MVNTKIKATIIIISLVLIAVILNLTGVLAPETQVVRSTNTPNLRGLMLNGAGATFPYPQIVEWTKRFYNKTGVSVNYQPIGSGAGLSQFFQNVTDFACIDPPLKKSDWIKYEGTVMQIPWVMGAVVVVYNIPEILPAGYNLKLTADLIAKIYRGDIKFWNDDEIKRLNSDLADKLPHKEIIAVYRSDSSGTTEVFTTFLYKASPNLWSKDLVGKTVEWPVVKVGRGVGGQGNPGVTQVIQTTPYSIGYVEWSFAITNNLQMAAIKNRDGNYVLPSETTLKEALKNVNIPTSPLDDFSHTLEEVVYVPGVNSYPITSPSYIILWRQYQVGDKAVAMSEFLKWVATEGYKNVVAGYVAPPEEVIKLLLKATELLTTK
ncbi:MAG: phosphate ABC transporter substrate-binding protein PstS [Sulfolobales archaeon]